MAPILYLILPSPPVRSVLMTAEALGLKLEHKQLDLMNKEHFSPEYTKLNPLHTVPTLDDDGFIVPDSHAIMTYLVDKYGKDDSLYPKDVQKRTIVNSRLHFDNGTLFVRGIGVVKRILFMGMTSVPTELSDPIIEGYGFVETFLKISPWIAGDNLTIADISCFTTLTAADIVVPIDPAKFPKTTAWIKKMEALPYSSVNKEGSERLKAALKSKLKA